MEQHTYQEAIEELRTVHDLIRWGVSRFEEAKIFFGHGYDNAWDEALALVLFAIHHKEETDARVLDAKLTCSERKDIIELFKMRIKERKPVAYISQEAYFAGLPFYVDERVLIPRSPIAELIERQFSPWVEPEKVTRILDLGTGSACIAIACQHYFPNAIVDAVDISPDAIAVAQRNVEHYQLQEKVRLINEDMFEGLIGQRYDIIVTNPPYVDEVELLQMPKEYLHEPIIALDGGSLGTDEAIRILYHASDYLRPHGILVLEVGLSQKHLVEFFPQVPFVWLDFQRGGSGVCLLTVDQLLEHKKDFAVAVKNTEMEG